jgi:hypothetical protein
LIIGFATRLLFAAYFLEAGLILVVAPWSAFWDRNFFAAAFPMVDAVLSSPYARGAVSGVGLITGLAGIAELGGAFASRRDASDFQRPTIPSNQ